ncbi:hypothetical protein ANO14919_074470 [Xylariales sp. No.14919]|nr:hypothetical protein ANO14919_074470 [Xylariales sp. No.14919]
MEPYSELEVVPLEDRRASIAAPQRQPEKVFAQTVPLEYRNHNIEAVEKDNEPSRINTTIPPGAQQSVRKICGLPLRVFYATLAIILVLVIGAIIGGVVGSLYSRSSHALSDTGDRGSPPTTGDDSTTDGDNSTSALTSRILPASQLSAANWTDPQGFMHRFVFFQDNSSAIITRRWDPYNRTWSTNNLTDILRTSRAPINPVGPFTPLASAACNFNSEVNRVRLWYIAPDHTIASVGVQDLVHEPEEWEINTLSGAMLEVYPGSRLASAWNRCRGSCVGYWALAYQRKSDAGINVANASNYKHPTLAIEPARVAQGSSLALMPEIQADGASVSRLTMMSESLSAPNAGLAQKTTYKTSWYLDGSLLGHADLPAPSPTLQFAITLLDNFRTVVFLALLPNGTVTGQYYRETFVDIPSVHFRGGPSGVNFTAVATSEEAMFYGISQGQILQYRIDDTDPSVFDFVGSVYD